MDSIMPDRDEFFSAGRRCQRAALRIADQMLGGLGGERSKLAGILAKLAEHLGGPDALHRLVSGELQLPSMEKVGNPLLAPWVERARDRLGPQVGPEAVLAEVTRSLLASQVVDSRGGVLDLIRQRGHHPWHFEARISSAVEEVSRKAAKLIMEGRSLRALKFPTPQVDHRSDDIGH